MRTFGKPPVRRSDSPTKACKKNEKHQEELEEQQQDQQPDEQKGRQCEKQPEAEEDKDGREYRKRGKCKSPDPKGGC